MSSYYERHKEEVIKKVVKRNREYRKTPMGRAVRLISNYKRDDRKANRCEGDLTPQWIVDNIFSKPCVYCGKEGWDVIGCNRIDNDKPHTMDNVEPCCKECNMKQNNISSQKKVGKFTLDSKLLTVYDSLKECIEDTGLPHTPICNCCNNKYLREGNNIFQNYIWKYVH